jgi:hypothetical protein
MILALFLLVGPVVLRNDTSLIPPHHRWRYDRFVTGRQLPVDVDCTFRVQKGAHVHVELMTDDNLEALRQGRKYDIIQTSSNGAIHQKIGLPGTFAIVIWNDDDLRPAEVALRLALDFPGKSITPAQTLSPQRKLTVILLSFVGFLSILIVSSRQLLKAMASQSPAAVEEPSADG